MAVSGATSVLVRSKLIVVEQMTTLYHNDYVRARRFHKIAQIFMPGAIAG
jgi:hypothetical protein